MKVVDAETMRMIDEKAINGYGLPGIALMENAGRCVAEVILKDFSDLIGKRVSIFCGKGNNGGDGMVVARHLQNRGVKPSVYLLSKEEALKGDAAINLKVWKGMEGMVNTIPSPSDLKRHEVSIRHSAVLVDAILGTGLKSDVQGIYSETIGFINSLGIPVVSVDIPSGLDSNTGRVLGKAVKANITVTLGLPKIGLLIHPGVEYTGRLEVADIGIPHRIIDEADPPYTLLDDKCIKRSLIKRRADFHKGDGGHLFVLAGSIGKTGAAALTSMAALRVGAGLVTLGVPESLNQMMEEKLTEVMTYPLKETEEKTLSFESLSEIKEALKGKKALALGPGLTTHPQVKRLISKLIEDVEIPVVIDADGLNCLAGKTDILKNARAPIVMTPHPGEMARLVEATSSSVQEDRLKIARSFAVEHSVTMVLKGARTLVSDPQGHLYINPTGNPGMASGGTGDVLTGVIGGLLSQGYTPVDSAKIGVYIHGMAGDRVAEKNGMVGLVATDILEKLPGVLQTLGDCP